MQGESDSHLAPDVRRGAFHGRSFRGRRAPAGWKIASVSPNTDAEVHGFTTDHVCPAVRNTPVSQAASFQDCIDGSGDDVGARTQQITAWRMQTIQLRQAAPAWLLR
ncbi:MAG TPA: hypothetical protein PKO15_09545 [Fibrobacteria bacterium]|nr:hypothetical protein [Fibrobacteria bacterium]HOX50444.1 hypothetical protein [Fibrobacteria bacterium]